MSGMPTKQTPYMLGDAHLSSAERAALFGRTSRRDDHDDDHEPLHLRFVVTGHTPGGLPLVSCEREDGRDALGIPKWTTFTPPTPIAFAMLLRALNLD